MDCLEPVKEEVSHNPIVVATGSMSLAYENNSNTVSISQAYATSSDNNRVMTDLPPSSGPRASTQLL